jgi:hypothetical protein
MPANRSKPVYAKYVEHVPPDVTAGIFWMKNRDPQHWRDDQQLEHVLGQYIISDKPMTEEEWARERADGLDAEPQFGDGREENHTVRADKLCCVSEGYMHHSRSGDFLERAVQYLYAVLLRLRRARLQVGLVDLDRVRAGSE